MSATAGIGNISMCRSAWSGKRINLEFDGVFQVAEIWINGQRIGEHKGGYTGFTFDITDAVKPGDNVVAVRVNNNWDAAARAARGRTYFFRRHLSRRADCRHRSGACHLVWHICHHAAGFKRVRHGERKNGSDERIRHGTTGHAENQRVGCERKNSRGNGIRANHRGGRDKYFRPNQCCRLRIPGFGRRKIRICIR